MTKTTLGLIVLWILLVILNIISMFTPCGFLTVCNYILCVMNAIMAIGITPQIIAEIKERRNR